MNKICLWALSTLNVSSLLSLDTLEYHVYFNYNKSSLDSIQEPAFKDSILLRLKNKRIDSICISAYSDDIGGDAYNLRLSKLRAENIHSILKLNLDSSIRYKVEGYGEISSNNSDSSIENRRENNRKCSIFIHYIPEKLVSFGTIPSPKTETGLIQFFDTARIGDLIALRVYFKAKSSKLLPTSIIFLDMLTQVLNKNKRKILISGHLEFGGKMVDNELFDLHTRTKNLSENRAKAVYDYLIETGIEKERLSYVGMKGNCPVGGKGSQDRRVEIEIIE